jgi:WD40 repeat protein
LDDGSRRARRARACRERQLLALDVSSREAAELLAKSSAPPCEPPLPDLHHLRLIEPLDRAWAAHTDGIWGCEVSKDGKYVASASRDGDVAVWDMERGTLVARGVTGEPEIRDCAITSDAERVVSVDATGRITVWDLRTMTVVAAFDAPPQRPLCIGGGRWIVAALASSCHFA